MKDFKLIILLFIAACSSNDYTKIGCDISTIESTDLVSEIFEVKISESINYDFKISSLIEDSIVQIWGLNDNKISVIDVFNEDIIGQLKIPNDGIFESLHVSDFYVQNKDSIFLFSEDTYQVFLFNGKDILNSWSINLHELNTKSIVGVNTYDGFRLFFDSKSGSFVFRCFPKYEPNNINFYKSPIYLTYCVREDKITLGSRNYPDYYFNKSKWSPIGMYVGVIVKDEQIIYDFPNSNFLFVENKNEINTYCVSNLKSSSSDFINRNSDFQQERNYNISQSFSIDLIENANSKFYYRIVKEAQNLKSSEGRLNPYLASKFSIYKISKDFKEVEKIEFPANIYDFTKVYATEKGILISLDNPFNPNNNEDLMRYEHFRFK